MPIHDQGYRRYGGKRQAQGRIWWVIARSGRVIPNQPPERLAQTIAVDIAEE